MPPLIDSADDLAVTLTKISRKARVYATRAQLMAHTHTPHQAAELAHELRLLANHVDDCADAATNMKGDLAEHVSELLNLSAKLGQFINQTIENATAAHKSEIPDEETRLRILKTTLDHVKAKAAAAAGDAGAP